MKQSKPLTFFGNERLATGVTTKVPVLRSLIKGGYDVQAVITPYTEGRSRQNRELEIAKVAEAHNILLIISSGDEEIIAKLTEMNTEAGILVAYGQVLPKMLIKIFPKGIINIHPSLLPRYRGSSPIEQTVLDGAKKTGVSLMKLTDKPDYGPIYAQKTVDLRGDETKQELADELSALGAKILLETLPAILEGKIAPKPQGNHQASYTRRLKKSDGAVDFSQPAQLIERQVRAYLNFPRSTAKIFGNDVILTKVRIAKDENNGDLVMKTGDGWLEIKELIAPSGRTMSGADFLRGYARS